MKTPSQYRLIGLDSVKGIIVQLQKLYYIKNTRKSVSSDIQTLRREFKKTRRSPVFLTNFEVFGYLMQHSFECLIELLKAFIIVREIQN